MNWLPFLLLGVAACAAAGQPESDDQGGSGAGSPAGSGAGGGIGAGSGGGPPASSCKVSQQSGDAIPPCGEHAPAGSFSPEVMWTWQPPELVKPDMRLGSFVTPLVANLTDDNHDGAIDLCDVPDVIVVETTVRTTTYDYAGHMYMLAGDTGKLELEFAGEVNLYATPAIGDIDGDGVSEIVTITLDQRLIAYRADGSVAWTGDSVDGVSGGPAIALYDLDGDGGVEILAGFQVFDAHGKKLWGDTGPSSQGPIATTPTAADLDGDGKLEVLFGSSAFHSDGTLYWRIPGFSAGHAAVGNFDADPEPEIIVTTAEGISLVEHDGTLKYGPLRPNGENAAVQCWQKPTVIHDFNGDKIADLAAGSCSNYATYGVGATALDSRWSANVSDPSGLATATAFDFLGSGVAEAIYGDEHQVYAFDGKTGEVAFSYARNSGTLVEYPIVVDVDNDASADFVFVASYPEVAYPEAPPDAKAGATIIALHDGMRRWVPTRRIWNQHAYHVTNVLEDGTIPQHMKKSWLGLNTFRANAQLEGGGDCEPEPK